MFGWWRPVVIVPQSIANRGGLELDGCLAHEWSHLDRRDVDSDIASELLCSSSQGDLLFIDSDGTLLRKMDPGFASHMVRAWSPLGSTNGQLVILSAGTLRDPVPQGKEPQTKLVAIDIGGNQKWSVDLSGRVIDSAIATNRPWLSVALADGSMRVIDVSTTLRSLPIHADASKNGKFRNPDGVVFKTGNIKKVATGRGLGNVANADREAWRQYGHDPGLVKVLAARIREQVVRPEVTTPEVALVEPDEEFAEGRIFTAIHKVRERSPQLRKKLLAARRRIGPLACDACDSPAVITDPTLSDAGFEAHHVVPLAIANREPTRLSDMAVLCATCHRLIHRAMHIQRKRLGTPP